MMAAAPNLTADQLGTLRQLYSIAPDFGGGAVGAPISQLASSYLPLYSSGAYNQSTDDPVRDALVQGGYLSWTQDGGGNTQLAPGASMIAADQRLRASTPQGGRGESVYAPASSPFGFAGQALSGGVSDRIKAMNAMNPILATGYEKSGGGLTKLPGMVGQIDPETGEQLMDYTGVNPGAWKGQSSFDRFLGSGAPAMLMLAPIAAPLMASLVAELGPLGAAAFKAAGSGIMGGGFNSSSLVGALGQQFGLPDWLQQLLPTISNAAQGRGVNPAGAGMTLAQILMRGGGNG